VSAARVFASIPSPSSGAIHIGPLQLRAYGLMIALGVVAAVWLTGRRVEQRKIGTREDISAVALWAVPAGVIGARLYHVITDWQRFRHHLIGIVQIWEGGLGIWGGIAGGVGVGLWVVKKRGLPPLLTLTCVAPALALAQAIGRWGNWWNQELFGKPTTLPWALRVSPTKAQSLGYPPGTTFHPTFLYESVWNLALCGFLLWLDHHRRLRPGRLFVWYVAGYTLMRFFIERLRIDPSNHIAGLRVNEWVAAGVFVVAVAFLLVDAIRERRRPDNSATVAPMAEDPVLYETRGSIAVLTLNRPERLNAWNGDLERRYFDLLDQCGSDPAVRAIVVTGAGRGFCAGADMDVLQGIGGQSADGMTRTARRQQWHTTTIPKPVIAAINGACAGIGLCQALLCDVRFAAAGAKFTTAFARRGLVAEHSISWILPRLVGPARALDLLMSGRVFLAEEAEHAGLVNEVVPGEKLLEHAIAYATDLITYSSPASMAVMKKQVWDDLDRPMRPANEAALDFMAESFTRSDFKEGVQSFLEKRNPNFPSYP
jgi:prolipoprotein diacylglyceryl transferase